jgi:hypothetical protein
VTVVAEKICCGRMGIEGDDWDTCGESDSCNREFCNRKIGIEGDGWDTCGESDSCGRGVSQ